MALSSRERYVAIAVAAACGIFVLDRFIVTPYMQELERLRTEHLSQPGDVAVQGSLGRFGRTLGPDLIDHAVGRDDLVRVQKQEREDGAGFPARQREPTAIVPHLERPENPEVQSALPPVAATSSRT